MFFLLKLFRVEKLLYKINIKFHIYLFTNSSDWLKCLPYFLVLFNIIFNHVIETMEIHLQLCHMMKSLLLHFESKLSLSGRGMQSLLIHLIKYWSPLIRKRNVSILKEYLAKPLVQPGPALETVLSLSHYVSPPLPQSL